MAKKILIDENKCIGCNTCALIDPDVFVIDETTYKAKVLKQPKEIGSTTQTAVSSCPVSAITIVEE